MKSRKYKNVITGEFATATPEDDKQGGVHYCVETDSGRRFYCYPEYIMHPFNLGAGWVRVKVS